MKRTLISAVAALGFSIIPSTALLAQSLETGYQIPFSFNAEGVQLPAGRYTLSNTGQQVSTLAGHRGSIMFLRVPGLTGKPGLAHLTFLRQGNDYVLREVWQSDGIGTRINVTDRERRIIKAQEEAKSAPPEFVLEATR